jgi:hypothetical protein
LRILDRPDGELRAANAPLDITRIGQGGWGFDASD